MANSLSGGDLYLDTGNGSTYSGSYDLIGDGSDSSSFTNSLFVNPLLAPLGYYGGPTETLALLPGSPAIGHGETLAGVTTDQRGFALDSPQPDIGAFQFQSSLVVNTTDDTPGADSPGLLTLRQAIALADADTTSTTPVAITFDPTVFASSQTITLTQGTLTLGGSSKVAIAPITITGPSAGVTISGDDSFTVFTVDSNTTATLSGLTITDGNNTSGGGILNAGTLTVSASTLSGNSADGFGGGIFNNGTLTVSASTFADNSAELGGGIYNYINSTLTVSASTFFGNSVLGEGGGIYNEDTLTLSASTLSGNSASNGGDAGGGIFNNGVTATLNSDIVAGNSGGDLGGDLGGDSVTPSSSFNLIGTGGSGGLSDTNGNQVNVPIASINLAPLGSYGGPTETLALLPGSVAIGSGSVGVTTDQRGFSSSHSPIDIGAFQSGPLVVNTTADSDSPGLLTLRDAIAIADADTTTTALPITFYPIVFATPQTITLTNGTLTLGGSSTVAIAPITITGPSAGVTISGDDSFTVFTVDNSTTATLFGLTITDGFDNVIRGGEGGGIYNNGTLTVSNSTLANNAVGGGFGDGAGIFNNSTLTVSNSTFVDNAASGGGGGIFNNGDNGTVTVSNSTLTGNTATFGGAIYNGGTLTVSASTLTGNSAGNSGGILNGGTATLNGDIVAGNNGGDLGGDSVNLSSSYNLIGSDGTGETLSGHNTVGVTLASLNLAPLGNYGGPTQTLALLPGSIAIGSGSIGSITDQRGFASVDNPIDIGAFQFQSSLVVNTTDDTPGADSPGLLTLRQAINLADADTTSTPLPITFDPKVFAASQTITLNSGTLTLGTDGTVAPITITGPSAGVTISGNDSLTGVFTNTGNTTATLSRLTIADGSDSFGGAILNNNGTLTVSDSTLSNDTAATSSGFGGGIYNGGTLIVIDSTFTGDEAAFGGAIANRGGTMTVSGSTFINDSNTTINYGFGGGIYNNGARRRSAAALSPATLPEASAAASLATQKPR